MAAPSSIDTTGRASAFIDALPVLPFHRRLFVKVGIGLFFDVFDLYIGAAVAGALVATSWARLDQIAPLTSLTLAGMIAGSLCAGLIGDAFGRRLAFRWSLGIVAVSSLVAALAPNIETLIVARIVTGAGLGVEAVLSYAAFGEFLSKRYRGRWLGFMALASNFGVIVAALAGYLIIPAFGWRWLFLVGAAGACLGWILRRDMPESPRWLESKGRYPEALREMGRFGVPVPPAAPGRADEISLGAEENRAPVALGRAVCVAIVMNAALYVAVFAFLTWLPSIMVAQGEALPKSLWINMLMSGGALVGTASGGLIADRLGRRAATALFATAAALAGMLFAAAHAEGQIIAGFALYVSVYALAVISAAIYTPELFATAHRLRGAGFSIAVGRACALFAPFALPWLLANYGLVGVAYMIAGVLIAEAAVVLLFGPETKAAGPLSSRDQFRAPPPSRSAPSAEHQALNNKGPTR